MKVRRIEASKLPTSAARAMPDSVALRSGGATANAFGGDMARSLAGVADASDKLAQSIQERAVKQQQEADRLAVMEAYVAASQREQDFLLNPETGLLNLRYGEARGVTRAGQDFYNAEGRRIQEEVLENENQRAMFYQMWSRNMISGAEGLAKHEVEQINAQKVNATGDTINTFAEQARIHGFNPELVRDQVQTIQQSVGALYQNDQVRADAQEAAMTDYISMVVQAQALDDPVQAQQTLDKYEHMVRPDAVTKLRGSLQNKVEAREMQQVLNGVVSRHGQDYDAMVAEVGETFGDDPYKYREAVSYVEFLRGQDEAAKRRAKVEEAEAKKRRIEELQAQNSLTPEQLAQAGLTSEQASAMYAAMDPDLVTNLGHYNALSEIIETSVEKRTPISADDILYGYTDYHVKWADRLALVEYLNKASTAADKVVDASAKAADKINKQYLDMATDYLKAAAASGEYGLNKENVEQVVVVLRDQAVRGELQGREIVEYAQQLLTTAHVEHRRFLPDKPVYTWQQEVERSGLGAPPEGLTMAEIVGEELDTSQQSYYREHISRITGLPAQDIDAATLRNVFYSTMNTPRPEGVPWDSVYFRGHWYGVNEKTGEYGVFLEGDSK
jgi:hypothetical protein